MVGWGWDVPQMGISFGFFIGVLDGFSMFEYGIWLGYDWDIDGFTMVYDGLICFTMG